MPRVQVVYGSRHGGTEGIAKRIGDVLRTSGAAVTVASVADDPDPAGFDAHVVGSGVYMGSWLKDAVAWTERNADVLGGHPVWLFSSGPLPGSTRGKYDDQLEEATLGPAEGPGSGGRRRVEELASAIHPRDHRFFLGAFDPDDPPRTMAERFVRLMPGSKGILPAGDFRPWDLIDGWAREIAAAVMEPAPVA